uniref:Cytochrome P450 n=1 Tax=Pristionchus pacificus TaxID=54126 RepID=A0A2A6CJA1_PRIPA|eukprot:PDM78305.1 cytochrome P450 [Pristionchus pacificus]
MKSLAVGDDDSNKKAFLDMLIAEKDRANLSMLDIREEVDTFMFAGHDTTSSALGWTIWCLSTHQDFQQRAYEEMRGHVHTLVVEVEREEVGEDGTNSGRSGHHSTME